MQDSRSLTTQAFSLPTFPNFVLRVWRLMRPSTALTEWTSAAISSFSMKTSRIRSLSSSMRFRCSPPGSSAAVRARLASYAAPISTFHRELSTPTTLPTTTSPISGVYRFLKGTTVRSLSVCLTLPAKREYIFLASSKVPVPLR